MFFEITLIQRLTLFLGYPTYSLTVTLASILIFTGVGALLSESAQAPAARSCRRCSRPSPCSRSSTSSRSRRSPTGSCDLPLVARVVIAFVVLAPLGICLGTFMPLGLGAVGRSPSTRASTSRGDGP